MNHIDSKTIHAAAEAVASNEYEQLEQFQAASRTPEAVAGGALDAEFGAALEGLDDGLSRRRWLQLMGASLALGAASTGCRYQEEKIAPYAFRPQNRIPGVPVKYATSLNFAGVAHPLEATSFDGRPIKLDGNKLHPDSLGASDTFTQARILELYCPERLRSPQLREGDAYRDSDWAAFSAAAAGLFAQDLSTVAVLAEPNASPTLGRLKNAFEARGGKWFTFTAIGDDNTRAGTKLAFGQNLRPHYHFDQAKVIVCLEADPLKLDPAVIRNNRKFAAGRDADHGAMSRLYVVEAANSITGSCADHRMSLPSSKLASFLGALAAAVAGRKAGDAVDGNLPYREKLLAAMAQDLRDHAGAGMVVVGESQPAEVHAAAWKLNQELGNLGTTIEFTQPLDADRPSGVESLKQLAAGAQSGSIKALLILGGNPVFDAPADIDIAKAIGGIENTIHATVHRNETSLVCDWLYNVAHPLESWGDGQSVDGSHCLSQPLIAPLFGGKSEIELLAGLLEGKEVAGLGLVQETAKPALQGDFQTAWNRAVHDGFVADTAAKPVAVSLSGGAYPSDDGAWKTKWDGKSLEFVFTPSLSVYDGRFANNAWLQELPDFHTKLTWENAALVSPETAEAFGLKQDTKVEFQVAGKSVSLPVNIQPGQARGTVGVAIGYGRTAAGKVGGDELGGVEIAGAAVNHLRTSSQWHWAGGATTNGKGPFYRLAATQEKWTIDATGRDEIQARMLMDKHGIRSRLLREGSFASYQEFLKKHPAGESGHDGHDHPAAGDKHSGAAKLTFLPVINSNFEPAAATPASEDTHAHAPQWPQNFHMHHELFDLTPGVRELYRQDNHALRNVWGMSIDLNKCTGCSACVIACQAENNIPIVGREQVQRHRIMHWMRIDSYFGNNLYNKEAAGLSKGVEGDDKMVVHQPVTCHHCENAPCETVCPVAATVHSTEGLNDMVYNRCIGTRYCGNNCPYKVRRFNYLNYSDAVTFLKYPGADRLSSGDRAIQNMMMNPEVTIRSRGVMEKCTYCVQRIQNTKIKAKNEQREIGANEITTACQDVCPAGAIKFGDLNHPQSDVHAAHASPRAYVMLEELNNYPRTRYLARVRNPHPALVDWDDRYGLPNHGESHEAAADKHA